MVGQTPARRIRRSVEAGQVFRSSGISRAPDRRKEPQHMVDGLHQALMGTKGQLQAERQRRRSAEQERDRLRGLLAPLYEAWLTLSGAQSENRAPPFPWRKPSRQLSRIRRAASRGPLLVHNDSFDSLVGAGEHGRRDFNSERPWHSSTKSSVYIPLPPGHHVESRAAAGARASPLVTRAGTTRRQTRASPCAGARRHLPGRPDW
jgi:hypothetical protein